MSALAYLVIPGQLKHKSEFDIIKLSGIDVLKFQFLFHLLTSFGGKNRDGRLEMSRVSYIFGFGDNKFMKKVFDVIPRSDKNVLTFHEFMIAVWSYCSLSEANLAGFAFHVYDSDQNDSLDAREADVMMKDLYGKYYTRNVEGQKLHAKVQRLGAQGVGKLFWAEFCKANPDALEVALMYQSKMRQKVLGIKRWQTITMERLSLTRGKFLNLREMLEVISSLTKKSQNLLGLDDCKRKKPKGASRYVPVKVLVKTNSGMLKKVDSSQNISKSNSSTSLNSTVANSSPLTHRKKKSGKTTDHSQLDDDTDSLKAAKKSSKKSRNEESFEGREGGTKSSGKRVKKSESSKNLIGGEEREDRDSKTKSNKSTKKRKKKAEEMVLCDF